MGFDGHGMGVIGKAFRLYITWLARGGVHLIPLPGCISVGSLLDD